MIHGHVDSVIKIQFVVGNSYHKHVHIMAYSPVVTVCVIHRFSPKKALSFMGIEARSSNLPQFLLDLI